MSEKTKKLLDSLNKITEPKQDKFAPPPSIPDTNRMWKSHIECGISSLPKSYEPIEWTKVEEDGDVDYWTAFDRVYGGLSQSRLVNRDGTEYNGKLYSKRRLVKGMDGNKFYSKCTVTADGRWFDNSGFPIDPPNEIEQETNSSEENA
jgi:hypothetical protein